MSIFLLYNSTSPWINTRNLYFFSIEYYKAFTAILIFLTVSKIKNETVKWRGNPRRNITSIPFDHDVLFIWRFLSKKGVVIL